MQGISINLGVYIPFNTLVSTVELCMLFRQDRPSVIMFLFFMICVPICKVVELVAVGFIFFVIGVFMIPLNNLFRNLGFFTESEPADCLIRAFVGIYIDCLFTRLFTG